MTTIGRHSTCVDLGWIACVDLETRTIDTGILKIIWKLMNFRKSVPFNQKLWDENSLDRKFIFSSSTEKFLNSNQEFSPKGQSPLLSGGRQTEELGKKTTSWPGKPLMSSGPGFESAPHWRETSALTTAPFLLFQMSVDLVICMQRSWSDNTKSVYFISKCKLFILCSLIFIWLCFFFVIFCSNILFGFLNSS